MTLYEQSSEQCHLKTIPNRNRASLLGAALEVINRNQINDQRALPVVRVNLR